MEKKGIRRAGNEMRRHAKKYGGHTGEPTLKEQGFYDKNSWKKTRLMALHRDNHLCQNCLRNNKITTANTVHHIQATSDNPDLSLDLTNLESLCRNCHDAMHEYKKPEKVYPKGVRVIKA